MTSTETENGKAPTRRRAPAMDNAPKPQDRQPKKAPARKPAVQREAEGVEMVEIPLDGETYEIPADPDDWTIAAIAAFEQNKTVTALQELLGPVQFFTLSRKGYRRRDLERVFDTFAQAGGFTTAGN